MKSDTIDDFGRFAMTIVQKQQLIQGLFGFLDLAKENNIDTGEKILFLGEYQRLLFESVILDISYILLDKVVDGKSRMQIEIGKVEKKLRDDVDKGTEDINYTVNQKDQTLKELLEIKDSKDYIRAIAAITTTRDKFVAHKDSDFSGKGILYQQLQLVMKNVRRCYEIRQLALKNVGEVRITSPAVYNHQNLIEALILQREIQTLYESLDYRIYLNKLDFWNEVVKPRMIEWGDSGE